MIAIDTNILVYAHREDSQFHEKALGCIIEIAQSTTLWAIPWPCVHEFFSITTHPKIFNPPTPLPLAVDQINAWMEAPNLMLLSEAADYWNTLEVLIHASQLSGPMIHDARIAALCLQHGVQELLTADRDFSRFPGLKIRNPLI